MRPPLRKVKYSISLASQTKLESYRAAGPLHGTSDYLKVGLFNPNPFGP